MSFTALVSSSASDRLEAARAFLLGLLAASRTGPIRPVTIVGASRGAADDLARSVAGSSEATVGLERLSLTQLAARFARASLADEGAAACSQPAPASPTAAPAKPTVVSAMVVAEKLAKDGSYSGWHGAHAGIGTLPLLLFGLVFAMTSSMSL